MRTASYEMRRFNSDLDHVYWVDRITGAIGGRMKFDEFQEVVSGKKRQQAEVVAAPDRASRWSRPMAGQTIMADIAEQLTILRSLPPAPDTYIAARRP
jgi:hypothetical protein